MLPRIPRFLPALFAAALALAPTIAPANACTSLNYTDAKGNSYFGRTMELKAELPYQLVYFPAGQKFESDPGEGHPPLRYESRYAMLAIAMPDVAPDAKEKPTLADLKALEGQNEAGLTFSILAYPTAAGPQKQVAMTRAILDATDLGSQLDARPVRQCRRGEGGARRPARGACAGQGAEGRGAALPFRAARQDRRLHRHRVSGGRDVGLRQSGRRHDQRAAIPLAPDQSRQLCRADQSRPLREPLPRL
jgi:hypothetical protein